MQAKHASKREVGAVVVLADVYNKPKTHLDLIKYIKLISEFTKNVPILYHHNPKFTNVNGNFIILMEFFVFFQFFS